MIDLNRLNLYRESRCLEAKRALGGLPESLWETYSAFANTCGGVILLGVGENKDRSLYPVDLPNPTELMRQFWAIVSDPALISANILTDEHVSWMELDGKDIIVIEVPEASPAQKPVYTGQDPYTGSYQRIGDGDFRCPRDTVEQMLRDAASARQEERS